MPRLGQPYLTALSHDLWHVYVTQKGKRKLVRKGRAWLVIPRLANAEIQLYALYFQQRSPGRGQPTHCVMKVIFLPN